MKSIGVEKLIALLQMMPPDAEVFYFWDGAPRSEVARVWLGQDGVILGDEETLPNQIYDAAILPLDDGGIVPGHWSHI